MKLKYLFIALLSIGFLSGCGGRSPELCKQKTEYNFDHPHKVGVLNGRELYRVRVVNYDIHDHYVYFFKNSDDVITMNRTVSQGKTTINTVQVIIDGKPYIATPKDN